MLLWAVAVIVTVGAVLSLITVTVADPALPLPAASVNADAPTAAVYVCPSVPEQVVVHTKPDPAMALPSQLLDIDRSENKNRFVTGVSLRVKV